MNLHETPNEQLRLVFVQYYNKLCNYAYTFLKDRDNCEDLVQEVFIKIWETRQDLITSDAIRYYLFTAVRNNCLTFLKKDNKRMLVPLYEEVTQETVANDEELPGAINYKKRLTEALQQLPPKCREVFLLSRISRQSYQEIADQLGISIKTVENQIGKALKILREVAKKPT